MSNPETATKTPYPPGRICPECGSPVSRHDGLLFCVPRRGCPRDELAAWDRELTEQMDKPTETAAPKHSGLKSFLLMCALAIIWLALAHYLAADPIGAFAINDR